MNLVPDFVSQLLPFLPHWRQWSYLRTIIVAVLAALPWLLIWPYLLYQRDPALFNEWLRLQDLTRGSGSVDPEARFDHLYYLLEAAVAGLGVAIAPEPLIAEDLASGRLAAPWGFVETKARWILCAPRGRENRNIAPLADWLRKELSL